MTEFVAGITKRSLVSTGSSGISSVRLTCPSTSQRRHSPGTPRSPRAPLFRPTSTPRQDEFIYLLEGRFDLLLDGKPLTATTGDLIRLPRNVPHGIFNKAEQPVKCVFWENTDT